MINQDRLFGSVRIHEGLRLKPYKDSKGLWTIGIGDLIHFKQMSFHEAIDLWNNGITESAAIKRCKHKLIKASLGARNVVGALAWEDLSDVRQEVLTEMVYQIGPTGVGLFRRTVRFIKAGEYTDAAKEMLDSKWHREDSPGRAETLAERFRTGTYVALH